MPTSNKPKEIILVSACLMGFATRYDGKSKLNNTCVNELANSVWIPVCPEQLGGLPTPRAAASIPDGSDGNLVLARKSVVKTCENEDVTEKFVNGAKMVAEIATSLQAKKVYLKAKSPSCGVSGKLGVTAALLKQKGFILKEFY